MELEGEREELNLNSVNSSKLSMNEDTRTSIPFSLTNAENRELSERPTPASSGSFHYRRVDTLETVQEAALEHSIDLRDDQTLINSCPEAITQFAVYKKEADAKINELQNEIIIMRENYNQKLRFLQDQLNKKIPDLKSRSPDETEASVHSLADDESVQSTHAVKSYAGEIDDYAKLAASIEEQARPACSDTHSAFNEQEDLKQELFVRSSSSQMADENCDHYARTKGPLLRPDTSVNLRLTSDLIIQLLTKEYIKLYMKVVEFKESIIKTIIGKEMISAAQAFREITVVRYSPDVDVLAQVRLMASSSQCILNEVLTVLRALLNTDGRECAVSSFDQLSYERTTISFNNSVYDKASVNAFQDNGKSTVSDFTVNPAEDPSKAEFQTTLQLPQQQLDDMTQKYEGEHCRNKRQHATTKSHISCLQLANLDAISQANTSQHRKSETLLDEAHIPDSTLLFTRADATHNTRVLVRGVNNKIISKQNYKNAVQTMKQYIDLQKARFSQLIKQYSQHVTLKEAEKKLKHQVVISKSISEVFKRMEELYIKRKKRWNEQTLKFTEQRTILANTLMNTLDHIEKESGLFLIKPSLSWKGRPDSMKNKAKVIICRRLPIRTGKMLRVPAPSSRFSEQIVTFSSIRSSMPKLVGLTSIHREELKDLPSRGNKISGSVENYLQGMWKMQIDSTESVTPCRKVFFTTPRLLEMELKRIGVAQRNVSCKVPQLTLGEEKTKNLLAHSKLQSYSTPKYPTLHHVPFLKSACEIEELHTHKLPPIKNSSEANLRPHSKKEIFEDARDQNTASSHH
ncbi:uncharacterized protein [Scyliorhinus torazame]|uniref:uncharacterized protein n=1 Tax=Scyliorhinus torazame TaxID=75743 RepID=UPI003B5B3851